MKPPRIFLWFVAALCALLPLLSLLGLVAVLTLYCSPSPTTPPPPPPEPELDLETADVGLLKWYSDPTFENFIIPQAWREEAAKCEADTAGDFYPPCECVITSPISDYRCTVLPDTVYGLIVRPYDRLFCVGDTCVSLRIDGVMYDIKNYRERMIKLCDEYIIIARIEDGIATLEDVATLKITNTPVATLPDRAKENDVLKIDAENGYRLIIDETETAARAARIGEHLQRLIN